MFPILCFLIFDCLSLSVDRSTWDNWHVYWWTVMGVNWWAGSETHNICLYLSLICLLFVWRIHPSTPITACCCLGTLLLSYFVGVILKNPCNQYQLAECQIFLISSKILTLAVNNTRIIPEKKESEHEERKLSQLKWFSCQIFFRILQMRKYFKPPRHATECKLCIHHQLN